MRSNKVCLVAALMGTLCPVSDAARAVEDLDVESAACHCACASSFSSALFQNQENEVYGTALYTGDDGKSSDIGFYVEVRHLTQGFGDPKTKMFRSCNWEFCNEADAVKLCPASQKLDASTAQTIQFLQDNREKLLDETGKKLTADGTPGYGWGISEIRKGQQTPAILALDDDPNVVVAVYWVALRSTRSTAIAERMIGWPFKPKDNQLQWGFEEVLNKPEERHADMTGLPDMTQIPRGIVVAQEVHKLLPPSE